MLRSADATFATSASSINGSRSMASWFVSSGIDRNDWVALFLRYLERARFRYPVYRTLSEFLASSHSSVIRAPVWSSLYHAKEKPYFTWQYSLSSGSNSSTSKKYSDSCKLGVNGILLIWPIIALRTLGAACINSIPKSMASNRLDLP